MYYQLTNCLFRADLTKKDSQIADLQENIKSQQAETSKAKEEPNDALTGMEQLKDGFKGERAEEAEAALNPVTEELTGLKRQINAMTSAIFGKNLFISYT